MARMMLKKAMGIITLALLSAGHIPSAEVPQWVIVSCALAMGLGTALGGWKIIRTLGMGIAKLEPVHGFAAETGAAAVLMATAHIGLPVSTTHTITSSVMGVGAVNRLSAVRWGVTRRIVYAWLFYSSRGGFASHSLIFSPIPFLLTSPHLSQILSLCYSGIIFSRLIPQKEG